MIERSGPWDDEPLEQALALLREDVMFPETPDLAAAFRNDVPETQMPGPRPAWSTGWRLAALAAIFVGVAVLSIPGARSTVAGWLELAGVDIEIGNDRGGSDDAPTSLGGELFLGRRVSLAEAQSAVSFEVLIPSSLSVGNEPDVYLDHRDGSPVISLLYPASETLPEIGDTGAGLLLTQFDPAGDTDAYIKRTAMDAAPEFLIVNGSWGAWIEDGSLTIPGDTARADVDRPSAHVLIWGVGGVTIRMETNLPRDEALGIARTLAPVTPPASSPPGGR